MSVNWYYAKGGERFGPVAFDQLKLLAASSVLKAKDLVWNEGSSKWVPAKVVPGLMSEAIDANEARHRDSDATRRDKHAPSAPNWNWVATGLALAILVVCAVVAIGKVPVGEKLSNLVYGCFGFIGIVAALLGLLVVINGVGWLMRTDSKRCITCGQNLGLSAGMSIKVCGKCEAARLEQERVDRQRLEESTARMIQDAPSYSPQSSRQCPKCKGSSVTTKNTITDLAAIAFQSKNCRDCKHEWAVPRPSSAVLTRLVGIALAMLGLAAGVLIFLYYLQSQPNPGNLTHGFSIIALVAISAEVALGRALLYCIKAIRLNL
jgi:hypothetical protein